MTRQGKGRAGDTAGVRGHPVRGGPMISCLGGEDKVKGRAAGRKTRLGQTPPSAAQARDPLIRAQTNFLNTQEGPAVAG